MALDMGVGNFYSALQVKSEEWIFFASVLARVAELADALDLGSSGQPWGFDSPLSHQTDHGNNVSQDTRIERLVYCHR